MGVFRVERLGDTGVALAVLGVLELDFGFASLGGAGFAVFGVDVGFAFGVLSFTLGLFTTGEGEGGATILFKLPTRGFFALLLLTFSSSSLLKSGEALPTPSSLLSLSFLVLLCRELAPNEGALFNVCLLPLVASMIGTSPQ